MLRQCARVAERGRRMTCRIKDGVELAGHHDGRGVVRTELLACVLHGCMARDAQMEIRQLRPGVRSQSVRGRTEE